SRRRHTRSKRDWSSDVCSSDLAFRRRLQDEARASGEAETDPRSALHFNCSGKHTAFLTAARAIGAETSTYLSADHPVQIRVAEEIGRASCRERRETQEDTRTVS